MVIEDRFNEARLDLVGLLVACPFNQDNPDNCPLHHLRLLPMAKRIEWLDQLADEDVLILRTNHQHCLHVKERCAYRSDSKN
jgi:hypothetical protein